MGHMFGLPWFLIPSELTRAFGNKLVDLGHTIGIWLGRAIQWIWIVLEQAWERLGPAVRETFAGTWVGASSLIQFWITLYRTAYNYLASIRPEYQVAGMIALVLATTAGVIVLFADRIASFIAYVIGVYKSYRTSNGGQHPSPVYPSAVAAAVVEPDAPVRHVRTSGTSRRGRDDPS